MIKKNYLLARRTLPSGIFNNHALKFTNKDVTLLCNNCIGGVILHDLNLPFNTPTINLYFNAPDYIAFLERLDYYLVQPISFSYQSKYDQDTRKYPVGTTDDIELHFVHYKSFDEAKNKWETRARRINRDNIFVIGSDRDFSTDQIVERFLRLPFKNKVFFSTRKNPAPEVIYFKEYAKMKEVPDLINHDHAWYFHFDTERWLDTGQIRRFSLITHGFQCYSWLKRSYQLLNQSQKKYERTTMNQAKVSELQGK